MRTSTAVLIIVTMSAVLGCTQAPEQIYVTATPHPRVATETAEAKVETERQVQEAIRATVAAIFPTPEPAPSLQTKVAPTSTQAPVPYGADENCDQLLRNQLVFQTDASTAGRMQEVIRQIHVQRENCVPELWSPVVDDASSVLVTGCHGSASLPLYTNPLVTKIGNLTVPGGLYTGFDPANDTVRKTSGRDSDNNIIVYWSAEAGRTPADGAKCWLHVSRLNSWDENFGEEYQTEERTTREPVHYTRVTSPEDIDETKEGEWYYIELDEEGIYAEVVMMVTPGDRMFTMYGCSTIKQMEITEPIVKIRYTNRLPMELITLGGVVKVRV